MNEGHIREPYLAGQWYEGNASRLERAVRRLTADWTPPDDLGELVGGVVPHAGWAYSGGPAAKVFLALSEKARPDTFVILGAAHRYYERTAAAYPSGAWRSPLGDAVIDEDLVAAMAEYSGGTIVASAQGHAGENSIEVQIPFIQALRPDAMIAPVLVPAVGDAVRVGEAVGKAVLAMPDKRAVVVASTDLTHYGMGYGGADHGPLPGAAPWLRENDHRIIRLIEAMRADDIVPEAHAHANACGPGAVAAAISATRAMGASRASVLEYTTSAEVMKESFTDRAVGYVGMVFEREANPNES